MSLLGHKDIAFIPEDIAYEYAAVDADAVFRSHLRLRKLLKKEGLQNYLRYPMMELSRCLLWSGLRGIKVHRTRAHQLADQLGIVMQTLEDQLQEYDPGPEFNPRASGQKAEFLFEKLGLPPFYEGEDERGERKRIPVPQTKTGQYQVSKPVLQLLFETYRHPAIEQLMELSSVSKLITTYVHPGLTKWMDPYDRVHTTFKLGGAITGRVTSSEPPIATIPRDKKYNLLEEEVELSIRDLFWCDEDYEITYADTSQAELCVLAICSGEESMIKDFKAGYDFHDQVVYSCLGVPKGTKQGEGNYTKEKRVAGKAINFGMVFGGGAPGIAANAKAPVELIEEAISTFFSKKRNVYRYLEGISMLAIADGRLTSPFGRIRRFTGLDRRNKQKVNSVARMAKNFNMQSGAQEVVFRSLIRICRRFKKYKMKAWPVNMVYDSIITDHPKSERRAVREIMIEEMTRPVPELDDFQFAIDIGQADSWGEAERHAEKIRPW